MENDGSVQTATESIVGLLQQTEGGLTSLSSDDKPEAKVVQKTENDQAIAEEDNQPLQTPTESVSAEDLPTEDETVDDQAVDETTETPEAETPQEEIYTVKVQGETYEVNRDELIAGYQRQQDYTRKTESLSIEKQQQLEDINKQTQLLDSKLAEAEKLTTNAKQQLGLDVQGLDELMLTDPVEGTRKKHELEMRARQIQMQDKQIQAYQNEKNTRHLKEQEKIVRLEIPEMNDPESRPKFVNEMRSYLDKMGFHDDEINGVTDSRYFKLIRDGLKWNQLQKSKPQLSKKVNHIPKVVKGGVVNSKSSKEAKANNDKFAKLRKSGSVEDATELLKDLFK